MALSTPISRSTAACDASHAMNHDSFSEYGRCFAAVCHHKQGHTRYVHSMGAPVTASAKKVYVLILDPAEAL